MEGRMGGEGGGWGCEAGGEVACEKEREGEEGKEGKKWDERDTSVGDVGECAREGHEETSREVAC